VADAQDETGSGKVVTLPRVTYTKIWKASRIAIS
jgi:hypothetical protein